MCTPVHTQGAHGTLAGQDGLSLQRLPQCWGLVPGQTLFLPGDPSVALASNPSWVTIEVSAASATVPHNRLAPSLLGASVPGCPCSEDLALLARECPSGLCSSSAQSLAGLTGPHRRFRAKGSPGPTPARLGRSQETGQEDTTLCRQIRQRTRSGLEAWMGEWSSEVLGAAGVSARLDPKCGGERLEGGRRRRSWRRRKGK